MFDSKWLIAEQEMFAAQNSEFNNTSNDPQEIFYRQNSTQLIQDMGTKLKV